MSESDRAIGVAVVGCGAIGAVHARLVSELEGAALIAVCDQRSTQAEELATGLEQVALPRPIVCSGLEEVLSIPDVELIVLTTPSNLHVEQATAVLAAGRHVLIEKPLDTQLSRARVMSARARTAETSGLVASVVSQHRFDSASEAVAAALAAGHFGELTTATATTSWWRSQGYYDSVPWRGSRSASGGGALMTQSIHMVDLLLTFMGRPREVFGMSTITAHEVIEVEDSAVATIAFESGAIATLHATTAAYPGLSTRIQVMGSRGSATIEDDELIYLHAAESSEAEPGDMGLTLSAGNQVALAAPRGSEHVRGPSQYQLDPASHRSQYLDLLAAIRDGRPPRVTLEDAFHALALVKAVYVSSALGAPIAFDDVVHGVYDHVDGD